MQPWRRIHGTPGVKRLFSASPENPTAIPIGVVERLMADMSKRLAVLLPTDTGDPLPVGAVAMASFGGVAMRTVVCVESDRHSGRVRVQDLESGHIVEVEAGALVPVE